MYVYNKQSKKYINKFDPLQFQEESFEDKYLKKLEEQYEILRGLFELSAKKLKLEERTERGKETLIIKKTKVRTI